ncbi:MAG: copper oxidase [Candidatus Babeliales bacterium]
MKLLYFVFTLFLFTLQNNAQKSLSSDCANGTKNNCSWFHSWHEKNSLFPEKKESCNAIKYQFAEHQHVLRPKLPKVLHTNSNIIPWKIPDAPISPLPRLMGKQMGTVETLGIPPLGYELDGNVKVFHLVAQPIEKYITDGKKPEYYDLVPKENRVMHGHHEPIIQKIKCWGYNGTTPGPTIEAFEGDRIRIVLKNELPEPTSIHWHGIEVPNNQDGAAPETQRPILPGETFTYEFTLYQSGTLMYHSGFNIMKQDHYGLHGMVVIHPKKYDNPIDRDIAIFLQQFRLLPGNDFPDLISNKFNWFTFNGFSAPSIPTIKVKQYQRVRIRFANTIMDAHPIHIHGYVWEEVGTEGGPIPQSARKKGSTIQVPSGTTRDVEFVAWNPGLWRLHCHMLHHVVNAHTDLPMGIMPHGGMFTLIHVEPKDPNAPWQHPKEKEVYHEI